jgi:hypothetical protein
LDWQRIKRLGREEKEEDFLAVLDGADGRYRLPHRIVLPTTVARWPVIDGHTTTISGPITATHFGVMLTIGGWIDVGQAWVIFLK